MTIYILAIIVAVLLIGILFFALRSTVKRIDYNTKKYFVDKLQDYDYLIEEKQNVLNELNEKIEKNKKTISELDNNKVEDNRTKSTKYYNNITIPKYSDENLFKKYKAIKNNFNFDCKKIIQEFINNNPETKDNDYETLLTIKQKFTNELVYKIISMKIGDQKTNTLDLLSDNEKVVLKKYMSFDKFKIKNFVTKLDIIIEKKDPAIYIISGDRKSNYNLISSRIKNVFDENINEGIRIKYKGIIYDYSL